MSQPPPLESQAPQSPLAYTTLPVQRASAASIASLVCGIVGCVPFITSLAAVILGWIGIRKTRDPNVGGKTLAIVGLVLGCVGLASWSLLGGVLLTAYVASKPARGVAHQFALDLSNGNVNAAVAASGGMTPEQLTAVADQMKPWGTLASTSFTGFNTRMNVDGSTICELSGTATFTVGGEKTYTVTLVKGGGTFKVQSFNLK